MMTPSTECMTRFVSREPHYADFTRDILAQFWQQREEGTFVGMEQIPVRFVRFTAAHHQRVIIVAPGRTESYVKHPELAFDLFSQGFDVFIIDHRGQGRSGRMLADSQRGHVTQFDDYVDDLEIFLRNEIAPHRYTQRFALACSMGGAILALLLLRQPHAFTAVALCAPMFGIRFPVPTWLARPFIENVNRLPFLRHAYALGTGKWRPEPYNKKNVLTRSQVRYEQSVRYYRDQPEVRLGGPTYQWVKESIHAAQRILDHAAQITTPLLLLQAGEERVVDNQAHWQFCQQRAAAGYPCEGNQPYVIEGAKHEILLERDELREKALSTILHFFEKYHSCGDTLTAPTSRG